MSWYESGPYLGMDFDQKSTQRKLQSNQPFCQTCFTSSKTWAIMSIPNSKTVRDDVLVGSPGSTEPLFVARSLKKLSGLFLEPPKGSSTSYGHPSLFYGLILNALKDDNHVIFLVTLR